MSYKGPRPIVERKIRILENFCIPVTEEVLANLNSLKDSEFALDRYVEKLIKEFLSKGERCS